MIASIAIVCRDIPGFPGYEAGDDGSVWAVCGEVRTELRQYVSPKGYRRVALCVGGKRIQRFVHCLVLIAFVGPRPKDMETRHLDGNKKNNVISNLCWGTPKQNAIDRERHGSTAKGQRCGRSKLTDAQVVEIRRQLATGRNQTAIAADFGVHSATISHIHTGHHRKHA